jgi:CBS domain-containing protein
MQTSVLTVAPETPLADVQRLFVEEGIGGAPVVDERGVVLGVITAADLLRAVDEERDTALAEPLYFRETLEFSSPDWTHRLEDFQDRLRELRASDAMTEGIVSVSPDAPVSEVARRMREHRVHRVLVVKDASLVGIVSTFDLVALLERQGPERGAAPHESVARGVAWGSAPGGEP